MYASAKRQATKKHRDIAAGRADAIAATLAVARNQRTYWRRDPRIRWLEWDDDPTVRLERAGRELEQ